MQDTYSPVTLGRGSSYLAVQSRGWDTDNRSVFTWEYRVQSITCEIQHYDKTGFGVDDVVQLWLSAVEVGLG